MNQFLKIFLIGLAFSCVLTPLVRYLALRFAVLDHPKSRKIHQKPIPKMGGLAIYFAFCVATLSSYDYNEPLKGILLGSSLVFSVGFWDDVRHLQARFRLLAQLVACSIAIYYGVVIKVFPWYWVNVFFTIIGIVGITNALNFLDNMDGLAGGLAAIISLVIAAIAINSKQRWLAFLSMALAGGSTGFLIFNFHPAKIFMGDSGSTFLGFSIACFAVMGEWSSDTFCAITIPVLILGILIFDMVMITVLRIQEGKVRNFRQWLEYADTDHFSHRLFRLGLGYRESVLFIYCCNLLLGLVALKLDELGPFFAFVSLAVFSLVGVLGVKILRQAPPLNTRKARKEGLV